jgi:recombination protein RecT
MADAVATTNTQANPVVQFIRADKMQKMVQERLGKRAGQFTTSLISLVNTNANIAACTPMTVIQAALTAASMDLPINQNLGFAYIVPYKNHGRMEAQFQMGWRGFVQLAQRSGKFKTINTTDVREGEVKTRDRMTGELEFAWLPDDKREAAPVVGYLAYFELLNGFKKSLYMTKVEIEAHAGRYSQAYKARGKGGFKSPWETDFGLMAQKTSLKLLLSKFAPLSTEMQEAIQAEQSVDDGTGRNYIDNDDLSDVHADEDKKKAIVAANKPAAPEAETAIESGSDEASEPPAAPKPKKSVKDMVAERGWDGKGKQASLVDDKDS